ncbi:Riboflavin synthase alpha chain [Tulasnella sp. UAMH 9824]|nr:Riboflavin synthase alpha chain [Tulasnella sp. UAMH 9824]
MLPYIIPKGFIALDGTSLTITIVNDAERTFGIMPIAHLGNPSEGSSSAPAKNVIASPVTTWFQKVYKWSSPKADLAECGLGTLLPARKHCAIIMKRLLDFYADIPTCAGLIESDFSLCRPGAGAADSRPKYVADAETWDKPDGHEFLHAARFGRFGQLVWFWKSFIRFRWRE